ncbi:T9SS type A sorting domain-containing protein, partial [uncultured Parabacteroides sp.]|uniref:T9SS type A sorting domain-containing protein n=1 Tax=uncultured Parabacteroides sp. TaxID=512312 RepID=UPI0026172F77
SRAAYLCCLGVLSDSNNLHLVVQKPQTIYILDVSGKVCSVILCQSGQSTVPMQKYPAGIYFVRMENRVVKVVKR